MGGIKEKILAGVTYGLSEALIPARNSKDLEDIPADLRAKIRIHLVSSIDEALPLIFGGNSKAPASDRKTVKSTSAKTALAKHPGTKKPEPKPASKPAAKATVPARSPRKRVTPPENAAVI